MFTSTFDIYSITNTVDINNFTFGYVFNTGNEIINAFVDISDSVYTSTVLPLF